MAHSDLLATLDIHEDHLPWKQSLQRIDKLGYLPKVLDALENAKAKVKKAYTNVSDPLLLLDVTKEALVNGVVIGVRLEAR